MSVSRKVANGHHLQQLEQELFGCSLVDHLDGHSVDPLRCDASGQQLDSQQWYSCILVFL